MQSITTDLPAPVSPVITVNPGVNSKFTCFMTAIFSMCKESNIYYSTPFILLF